MKLSEKDKDFLIKLKDLVEDRQLWVELSADDPSYMILKGTYGEKIHKVFHTTRQGVRWRFQRVFGDMYISAFETILMIEKLFGSHLREYAIRISKERYTLRQHILQENSFQSADTLVKNDINQCSNNTEEGKDGTVN